MLSGEEGQLSVRLLRQDKARQSNAQVNGESDRGGNQRRAVVVTVRSLDCVLTELKATAGP